MNHPTPEEHTRQTALEDLNATNVKKSILANRVEKDPNPMWQELKKLIRLHRTALRNYIRCPDCTYFGTLIVIKHGIATSENFDSPYYVILIHN